MSISLNLGTLLASPKLTYASIQVCNMVCRPTITMSNKEIPEETRKYTAKREFCTEALGLMNNLFFVSFIEYLGGQISAIKETGNFIDRKMLKNIKKSTIYNLSEKDKRIKTGIFIASFVGSAFSGAILTPLLNNLILNKVMNKNNTKKDKTPELKKINLTKQLAPEENLFKKYNKLIENKHNC